MQLLRLTPGVPRPALLTALTAALVVLGAPLAVPGARGAALAAAAFVVLLASALALVVWRLRRSGAEREVWRNLGWCLGLVPLGAAAAALTEVAGADERLVTALLCAVLLAMLSFTHLAVMRWTRPARGGQAVDRDHVVTTVASITVLSAGVQLATHLWDGGRDIGFDPELPLVVSAAGGAVMATTLLLLTRGAWRRGDPRPLLLVVALAVGAVGNTTVLALGVDLLPWVVMTRVPWPLAVALCAALPVVPRPAEREDVVISTLGGYAVTAAALPVAAVAVVEGLADVAAVALVAGVLASVRLVLNVRELRQLVDHRRAAFTDALTGLPNRRAVVAELERALAAEQESVVAVLDLDGFKAVNDAHGHRAGDALLVVVAERLKELLLPGEMVARLGGDEFVVLAPVAPVSPGGGAVRARALGAAVLTALEAPVDLGRATVVVRASVGTATSVPSPALGGDGPRRVPPADRLAPAERASLLLHAADLAMYAAKRSGTGWAAHGGQDEADEEVLRRALSSPSEVRGSAHRALGPGQGARHQPQ